MRSSVLVQETLAAGSRTEGTDSSMEGVGFIGAPCTHTLSHAAVSETRHEQSTGEARLLGLCRGASQKPSQPAVT